MILVTGGTGFVGRVLINNLVTLGKPVRTLLRPSQVSPDLPRGIPVEVAVCSLKDERSLRAAMKDVKVIYHLVSSERLGGRADLTGVDIEGTETIANVAARAGVGRLVYLSHLGADRASAFPVLQAKAIAEGHITMSGVPYTIIRSAVLFGRNDHFFTSLVKLMRSLPLIFLMAGDGNTSMQPLWVDDLVMCLLWAIEDHEKENQIISIGGPEYLTMRDVLAMMMETLKTRRLIVNVPPAYLRIFSLWLEQYYPKLPISRFWLDYIAVDRTTALDTIPRLFGVMPARFKNNLNYLRDLSR